MEALVQQQEGLLGSVAMPLQAMPTVVICSVCYLQLAICFQRRSGPEDAPHQHARSQSA